MSSRILMGAAALLLTACQAAPVHSAGSTINPAAGAGELALLVTDPGAVGSAPTAAVEGAVLAMGRTQFQAVCGACHGANARGGRGGAPDLLVSAVALNSDASFHEAVRAGSPARGMPGFPLDDATLDAMRAHLLSMAAAARRRGDREIAVVGNAQRGHAFFHGAGGCTACHSVAGDLKGIGARYSPQVLQGRIVLPRGNGVHPGLLALGVRIPGVTDRPPANDAPRRVTVALPEGGTMEGVLVSISDFDVALRDAQGHYWSFARRGIVPQVVVHDPVQAHVDRLGRVRDRDLHDLTAYLVSLK